MQYRIKKITYKKDISYRVEYIYPIITRFEFWETIDKIFKTEQEARKRIKDTQDYCENKKEEIINL